MKSTENYSVTRDDIDRWRCDVKPFPLPDYMVPLDGVPMLETPIDVLMDAPAHLIVHLQRTAAQGGMQVVSPRQTPFSALMLRTPGGDRQLGDHVVGSISDPSNEWPTIDDACFDDLLPDEPLPGRDLEKVMKQKTKTDSITKAGKLLSDPILACLVKGRAVIDILRREDVAGGAEVMTEVLAKAWGVGTKEIDDMDAFTLGLQGPLLRHAIKADEVYPMCYAPIHVRRCISTGVNEVSRQLLPDDSAMDWRRMRVHCEAVFMMACAVEGHPIKRMRCFPPPGDPMARSNRNGVMVFMPAPATAWSFASETFSIYPNATMLVKQTSAIPREVLEALSRYTSIVRPVSFALAVGHKAATRRTTTGSVTMPPGETISEAYRLLSRSVMVGSARGRGAAATVRNLIYNAIETAPITQRMRIMRYLTIAKEECSIHLGVSTVPDLVIDKVANKFVEVGEMIRLHVVAEAARRGATAERWWADIVAQAPECYKMLTEGTRGWARIGMWMVFKAPTDRWENLVKAVRYNALRDASVMSVRGISLPAEKGSKERVIAAARAAAKAITTAYSAYYSGVADVGLAVADAADEAGKPRTADTLREASYLWMLRARCFRGTNVNPIARDEDTPSDNHHRVYGDPIDLILAPAPYRAYEAYVKHVNESKIIPPAVKRQLTTEKGTKVSQVFSGMSGIILPAKESTLTQYLLNPRELGAKMEQAWRELTGDLREVMDTYGAKEKLPPAPDPDPVEIEGTPIDIGFLAVPMVVSKFDYFATIAEMDEDEVDWMEDMMDKLPPHESEEIMSMQFDSPAQLRSVMLGVQKEFTSKTRKIGDFVR
jgi:hypothetical protein